MNQKCEEKSEDKLCPICRGIGTWWSYTPSFELIECSPIFECQACFHKWIRKPLENTRAIAEEMVERSSSTLSAEWILSKLPKNKSHANKLKVLDIGCWDGTLLDQLPSPWIRHGVELNHGAAMEARAKGLEVFHGSIEALKLEPASYDLIFMMDVLEHIPDPLEVLHELSKLLAPEGCFVALTGNGASLSTKFFKGCWYYFNYPEHVSFFSPRSAKFALNHMGLSFVDVKKVSHHGCSATSTLIKITKRLFQKRKEGVASLIVAKDSSSNLKLIASRVLRRADHLIIVGCKN